MVRRSRIYIRALDQRIEASNAAPAFKAGWRLFFREWSEWYEETIDSVFDMLSGHTADTAEAYVIRAQDWAHDFESAGGVPPAPGPRPEGPPSLLPDFFGQNKGLVTAGVVVVGLLAVAYLFGRR